MKKVWIDKLEKLLKEGVSPEDKLFAQKYADKAKGAIDRTMKGMDQEAGETRKMASSFFRLLEHNLNLNDRSDPPSQEEIRQAIEQLKDVGKFSVFVTAVIFPGGVFSLIGLELLANKYGIKFSFIPSAFRKKENPDTTDKESDPSTENSPPALPQ